MGPESFGESHNRRSYGLKEKSGQFNCNGTASHAYSPAFIDRSCAQMLALGT